MCVCECVKVWRCRFFQRIKKQVIKTKYEKAITYGDLRERILFHVHKQQQKQQFNPFEPKRTEMFHNITRKIQWLLIKRRKKRKKISGLYPLAKRIVNLEIWKSLRKSVRNEQQQQILLLGKQLPYSHHGWGEVVDFHFCLLNGEKKNGKEKPFNPFSLWRDQFCFLGFQHFFLGGFLKFLKLCWAPSPHISLFQYTHKIYNNFYVTQDEPQNSPPKGNWEKSQFNTNKLSVQFTSIQIEVHKDVLDLREDYYNNNTSMRI